MNHDEREVQRLVAAIKAARQKADTLSAASRVAARKRNEANIAAEQAVNELHVAKSALLAFIGENQNP